MVIGWKSEYKLIYKKHPLRLISQFPLVFVSFISDPVYIHPTALDMPLKKLSFQESLFNTFENSILQLIAKICASAYICQFLGSYPYIVLAI